MPTPDSLTVLGFDPLPKLRVLADNKRGYRRCVCVFRRGCWAAVEANGGFVVAHVPTGTCLGNGRSGVTVERDSDTAINAVRAIAEDWHDFGADLAFGDVTTPFPQGIYDASNVARFGGDRG
jgi:hypothetical protein